MRDNIKGLLKWILFIICIAIFFVARNLAVRTTSDTLLPLEDMNITIRREVIYPQYYECTTEQLLTQEEQRSFISLFAKTKLLRSSDEFIIISDTRYYISVKDLTGNKLCDIKIYDKKHLDCYLYNSEGRSGSAYKILDTGLFEFLNDLKFAEVYQKPR